ncbi:MAG: hypothetical protein N3D85_00435 [Candidatus Bathyarchaeota archaeon]|nr:hypothetical protein [Candidatus Bathyarchaeota archaeon]
MKLKNAQLSFRGFSGRKLLLSVVIVLFVVSIILSLVSFFTVETYESQSSLIINDSFRLTPNETYRQGLGSFRGGENVSITVKSQGSGNFNFSLLTYGGASYKNYSITGFRFTFTAGSDYYEASFLANSATSRDVQFEVSVQKTRVYFPLSWLAPFAKVLFFAGGGALLGILLLESKNKRVEATMQRLYVLSQRDYRKLQIFLMLSLMCWLSLLVLNNYPLATFENWYTDHARNSYSAQLFSKVGFSLFNTPLGELSSDDNSFFKFVTWADMPHLYPLGSVLLFFPFGWLLQSGVMQAIVFKLEIGLFLVISHICMYFFLKSYWTHEVSLSFIQYPWRQNFSLALKIVSVYLLYIVLVVYSANGMFDTVAFLFTLFAVSRFFEKRFDLFLLFGAIALFFKYQVGIFLLPLVVVSIVQLLQQTSIKIMLRKKAVLFAVALASFSLLTACLSLPFLVAVKPEFIMNTVNAFNLHAQVPWAFQAFVVLLTVFVTLICAVYLLNRSSLVSLFMFFSLFPCFSMPYFQVWYLPSFFVYLLFPREKRTLEVTIIWVIFMAVVLTFGGFVYSPLTLFENIRQVIGI